MADITPDLKGINSNAVTSKRTDYNYFRKP